MSGKKLRIAFFGDDFSRQGKGTALVVQKIANELFANYNDEVEIVLLRPFGVCKSPICKHVQSFEIQIFFSTTLSYLWFFMTHREQYDAVIFNRVVYPFFWLLRSKKFILFLYDAPQSQIYTVPKSFANGAFEYFLRLIGKYFLDAVIAVSYDAQENITCYYKIMHQKIQIMYLAASDDFKVFPNEKRLKWRNVLLNKYGIRSPYILDVSRFDPHKNIHRVLDAFCGVKEQYQIPHSLVLVGGKHTADYSQFIENKINDSQFRNDILIAEYIIPEDMPALYNCAEILIFPSLVEGFGLPIVEAMKCGTPVVTSNISSMPEISQGATYLVSPLDIKAIANAIWQILSENNLRESLIKRGINTSRDYSWQNSTRQFMNIIRM